MGIPRSPVLALTMLLSLTACADPRSAAPSADRVPLAVLGDSDSHAYQDRISFPEGDAQRGGANRARSLQWTEVLARLRAHEIAPGEWGEWGTRGRWARVAALWGGSLRVPRKQDFEFNFAWSGARCADLLEGVGRQAPRLVARMDEHPEAWRSGVVVIRIGINDLGTREVLDAFARDGDSQGNRRTVDACVAHVRATVGRIAERHPETAILLVGVLDNVDWPRNLGRWQEPEARHRIASMLDRFDAGLRAIAGESPRRAFFDDRAFHRRLVGGRGPDGRPAYREVAVRDDTGAPVLSATFTEGDAASSLYLADGHAGTVLNAHWAQAVVAALRADLGLPLTAISDAERDAFLLRTLAEAPEP